nr:hypothetical protein PJ912_00235 [Pectobacterium colocasium]
MTKNMISNSESQLPAEQVNDGQAWLTAEEFVGMEGMPGTAKGARLRLEKLADLHPEIKRKRTRERGSCTILVRRECR